MSKELAKQTLELFDTPEKWNTFIEIANLRDEMRNQIFKNTKIKLLDYFNSNPVDGWSFKSWDPWDYRWFLTDYTDNSFGIWMWGVNIGFYYLGSKKEKALELFNSSYYSKLKECFRPDVEGGKVFLYYEHGNFKFDSIYDENFEDDTLAGYIKNEPEKYLEQVIKKIDKIRRNPEFVKLIKEFNDELKED